MKISFPMMGNYNVPVTYLLKKILDCDIICPPNITSKTIEIGTKNSPSYVCTPFKYTLGTMIECLDMGADILIQLGGGCRYGYYSELQDKIIQDLGYKCTVINLVTRGKIDIKKIYKELKKINPHFKILKSIYYFTIMSIMIKSMDNIDDYIRQNVGFEVKHNSFNKLKKKMLNEYSRVSNITSMIHLHYKYKKLFKKLEINKPNDCLKIGLIGELYTIMEPFSNFEIEKMLASYNISIKRYTNVWYLLYTKWYKIKSMMFHNGYIKYKMGADASDNICRAIYLCSHGYDGIIHIKSTFCTPEIGSMLIINKVCNKNNIPVLFFSFDSNTSYIGVKTRIEAFYDMICMRKSVNDEKTSLLT